jgi:hypothetical protein
VLDEDVLDVVTGAQDLLIGVAVPVSLQGEVVVGRADKCVANDGVAAA